MCNIDQELVTAVTANNLNAVTQLLQSGANVRTNEDTCIKHSVEYGYLDIILELLKYNADLHAHYDRALRWSAQSGHLDAVTTLLEMGANINAGEGVVHTALEFGARHNRLDIVTALLEFGADVHVDNDCTLYESCERKHWKVIEKLLEYGANIHCYDSAILKNLQESFGFDEQLADLLLPYCCADDYKYFPEDYIRRKIITIKSANNLFNHS